MADVPSMLLFVLGRPVWAVLFPLLGLGRTRDTLPRALVRFQD